jgi:parallel beta-helix repeat protein
MKREGLVLILVCLLICGFIFTPVSSESKNESVSRKPSQRGTLIVGQGQTYTTIGDAVTAAQPGDTIYVYAGTYNEGVVLSKRLSLIGNGSAVTIIDNMGSNNPLEITADLCNVTGFTLKGSSGAVTNAGLLINADFNRIWDCSCSNNQGNGIRIGALGNNTIENCTMTNNGRVGVRIQSSSYNVVKWCNIKYNQESGIHLQNTQGNLLENNSISDSIGPTEPSISISSVQDNIIKFNYLGNDELGMNVAMGSGNLIVYNTIENQSSFAIDFGGNSNNNNVHHNNFINCHQPDIQVSDGGTGNVWDDGYPSGGNYWSDWTTPDTQSGPNQNQPGSDGFVDIPYDIAVGINDSYPLTNPFLLLNITTTDVIIATEDIQYSVTYEVSTNIPDSILTWELHTDASWLSRTGRTIHGTPDNSDVGSYWVNVSVSNSTYLDSHNFTLTVQNVNDPPEINTTDVLTVNETEPYSVDYNASDIDPTNDILAWGVDTNTTFLLIDAITGVLSGTPSRDDLGNYFVNVTVNDGNNGWDFRNFTLRVLNLNDPPEINTTDILTVNENELYSVDYEANDIDPTNDTLVWGVGTNATFLSMDAGTGVLSGTPSRDDLGGYYVNVTVNDGKGGWDNSNFTLTVLNVNDAPVINYSWADFSFDEDTVDESISLNDWFMDYDGTELTFSYSGNDKLTISILGTSIVRLVPEANWSGYEVLTFYANDSVFEVSDTVNITVLPVNDAPFNPTIVVLVTNLTEGKEQTVRGNASDVDIPYGDSITFSWSSNVSGFIADGMEVNLSLDAGHHMITLNASDSAGAWVETTMNIEIQPPKKIEINESDTDSDNLPDDWEKQHFGNLSQGKDDDPDNDTFTNYQEWENNTNPNDPEDYPGKVVDQPDDDDGDETSFITDYWWLMLLLFLIIILLIIFALISTRKKKEEEEEVPAEEKELECPECGAAVGVGEAICPECGSKFEEGAEEFECPECGTTVGTGITVCPQCGAEFEGVEGEPEESGELAEKEPVEEEMPEGEEVVEVEKDIDELEKELEELEDEELLEGEIEEEELEKELAEVEEPVKETPEEVQEETTNDEEAKADNPPSDPNTPPPA